MIMLWFNIKYKQRNENAAYQSSPVKLSVMIETFYVSAAQQGSHCPHVAIEQLKCG